MKKQLAHIVTAFADAPTAGNLAAVCLLPDAQALSDQTMQRIATDLNLSETSFLWPEGHHYRLRWFTPTCEVDLCGHATLAAAHVLWEQQILTPKQDAHFSTRSGILKAHQTPTIIELNFPQEPAHPVSLPPELITALGIQPIYTGKNRFDALLEVEHPDMVRNLTPDFTLLAQFPFRGIMVTSRSDNPDYDFISRFFAPAAGINEDPVTGSAHCCLGPYWAAKLNKTTLQAYQASPRGGQVHIRLEQDRAILGGKALTLETKELFPCQPSCAD